jgi:hypothetical protein
MSNALAIASVTMTLRNLIAEGCRDELGGGDVTVRPLDKARENRDGSNQINIFLYQTLPNAAWRNQDIPDRVKPGETGKPPLALTLYYLITAYGKEENQDATDHRLLGKAMAVLHDNAILKPADIRAALPENDLYNQLERVRIVPQPLSLEELSKLWSTFQTQYRISAAYEVSVVLIDSSYPVKTPLPVLTRGQGDIGVATQADLTPPFPTLEALQLPNRQPSLRNGEILTLQGTHLKSQGATIIRLMHPRLTRAIELVPLPGGGATQLQVELPNRTADLPAGFYTVTVQVQREGKTQVTNALSFSLAPQITNWEISRRQLTVNCLPQIWNGQRVALLIGDRELLPQGEAEENQDRIAVTLRKTDTLIFDLTGITADEYFVRLRVDGVDSLLVDRTVTPPVFDPSQKVRLP